MEEGTSSQQNPMNPGEVGFPQSTSPGAPKSKTSLVIFIILAILLIAGGVVFFVARNRESSDLASPSPSSFTEPSPTPTPSPTAKPVDKAAIKIEVLNGTGVPGEAAYLQGVLKGMGYENVTAGNSTTSNETVTAITFATGTPKEVMDEIEKKLNTIYSEVKSTTSSTLKTSNVKIITGLRKGASPKPSVSPSASVTPKPSVSPTPKPSTSPSPSATASPSPSPSAQ